MKTDTLENLYLTQRKVVMEEMSNKNIANDRSNYFFISSKIKNKCTDPSNLKAALLLRAMYIMQKPT